jgi:hypothetical protein
MMGEPLTEAERGYLHWWRRRNGIPTPRSGHRMHPARAHEVRLPPPRVTVYEAICRVLKESPAPLHEREIARLVGEGYPPLAQHIRDLEDRVSATLHKRRKSRPFDRVAPATWCWNGTSPGEAAPGR